MAEKKGAVPPDYDVNAKWDACLDLTVRRFVYSSLGGAFAGLLFFRSPVTRWASIALGAGIGIGSAYTDCSRAFDAPSSSSPNLASPKTTPKTSVSQGADE
ncbi:MICOS complex subunit Mic10 [Capsella rubella]|uniref:MICOS complex subunit Mic10 n=1 Tax=Capsella rubella TaxID=81985 RepID=UPI000CD5A694|nr:MICOS complex subunit Mic10 [Capsella rubella]